MILCLFSIFTSHTWAVKEDDPHHFQTLKGLAMPNNLFPRITLVLSHLKSLRSRQSKLDNQIALEERRLAPNAQQLHWLQVRRLMVNEQIQRHSEILQNLKEALLHGSARKVA